MAEKVTTHNAAEILKRIEEGQRAELEENRLRMEAVANGGAQATMTLEGDKPKQDEAEPKGEGEAPERDDDTGEGQDGDPEPKAPDDAEVAARLEAAEKRAEEAERKLAELEKKHSLLDTQFRSIQREITPTQQKNARLLKEVAQLKAQIAAPPQTPAGVEDELEAFSELYPESAARLRKVLSAASAQSQPPADEPDGEDDIDETELAERTLSIIQSAHRATPLAEISSDIGFWNFVKEIDKTRPRGLPQLFDICQKPWRYPGGTEDVIEIISDYLASRASGSEPAPPPPVEKPPAPPTKRPSDVAPPVSKANVPIRPNANPFEGKILSDAQIDDLNREIRKASPSRRAEIIKILDEQSRMLMEMAGRP